MPTTSNYSLRYPALSDDPNIPEDMQNLATDVDDEILRVDADITAQVARLDELLLGYAAPTQVGSGTLSTGGNGVTIMSVSISDPGFPYRIKASGSIGWGIIAASTAAAVFEASITIDSAVYNVGVLAKGIVLSHSTGASFSQTTNHVPLKVSGDQTGAHTVRLIARNSGATSYTIPAASTETTLTVWLVPVV
jgi:hypothetical protein